MHDVGEPTQLAGLKTSRFPFEPPNQMWSLAEVEVDMIKYLQKQKRKVSKMFRTSKIFGGDFPRRPASRIVGPLRSRRLIAAPLWAFYSPYLANRREIVVHDCEMGLYA